VKTVIGHKVISQKVDLRGVANKAIDAADQLDLQISIHAPEDKLMLLSKQAKLIVKALQKLRKDLAK